MKNRPKIGVKVYKNEQKDQEIKKGIISSGMIIDAIPEDGSQTKQYIVSVIGDMTGNGDCGVTELTKINKIFI